MQTLDVQMFNKWIHKYIVTTIPKAAKKWTRKVFGSTLAKKSTKEVVYQCLVKNLIATDCVFTSNLTKQIKKIYIKA